MGSMAVSRWALSGGITGFSVRIKFQDEARFGTKAMKTTSTIWILLRAAVLRVPARLDGTLQM